MKLPVAGVALLFCACTLGTSAATHSAAKTVTAKSVVLQAGDVAGVSKCPQSDSWADLMLKGEPEMLPTGFASWSDLKASGATDGWLSLYAASETECPLLLGYAPPAKPLVYSAVITFKDPTTAANSFAIVSQGFPVAADFATRFAAAGGTVTSGASIGLGDNSLVATISLRGVPTFVAYWQHKNFEAVIYADNLTSAEADAAINRMNGRIH